MKFKIWSAKYSKYDDMLKRYPKLKEFEIECVSEEHRYLGGSVIVNHYAYITINTLELLKELNTSVRCSLIIDFCEHKIIIYDDYVE